MICPSVCLLVCLPVHVCFSTSLPTYRSVSIAKADLSVCLTRPLQYTWHPPTPSEVRHTNALRHMRYFTDFYYGCLPSLKKVLEDNFDVPELQFHLRVTGFQLRHDAGVGVGARYQPRF